VALRNDLKKPVAAPKLDALDRVIATRVRYPADYTGKDNKPRPIETYLKPRLQKFAAFDAESFRKSFLDLAGMPK
jgi:hypothetical protein